MYITALGVIVAITVGNFIWASRECKWDEALERSFFQAAAIGAYLLVIALN